MTIATITQKKTRIVFAFLLMCSWVIAAAVFAQASWAEEIDYSKADSVAQPNADYSKVDWDIADQRQVPASRIWEIPADQIKILQVTNKEMIQENQWRYGNNLNKGTGKIGGWRDALSAEYPGVNLQVIDGSVTLEKEKGCIRNFASGCQPIINFDSITSLSDGTFKLVAKIKSKLENENVLEGVATYKEEADTQTTTLEKDSSLTKKDGVEIVSLSEQTQVTETSGETSIAGNALVKLDTGTTLVGSYHYKNEFYLSDGVFGIEPVVEGNTLYGFGAVSLHEEDRVSISYLDSDIKILSENSKIFAFTNSFVENLPQGSVSSDNIEKAALDAVKDVYGDNFKQTSTEIGNSFLEFTGFKTNDQAQRKITTGVKLLDYTLGGPVAVVATFAKGDLNIVNLETEDKTLYFGSSLYFDSSRFIDPEKASHFLLDAGARSDVLGDTSLKFDITQEIKKATGTWDALGSGFNLGVKYIEQDEMDNAVTTYFLSYFATF